MGKTSTFSNDFLKLIFNGAAIANIADNAATSPLTNLYMSLHSADPGITGNQTTNEVAYTSYARVALARTSGGWTVTGANCSPTAVVNFPQCTGSTATATYLGIGTSSSGTGKLLMSGSLSPTISISTGVTPQITTTTVIQDS